MEIAKIVVDDFGGAPVAEHNMPCPICRKKPAVLYLNKGQFHPCRKCESEGWRTYKVRGLMKKFLDWYTGAPYQ